MDSAGSCATVLPDVRHVDMTDPIPAEARAANLRLWNAWTKIHETSEFYDVEGFKAGATSLWPLELEELGPLVPRGHDVCCTCSATSASTRSAGRASAPRWSASTSPTKPSTWRGVWPPRSASPAAREFVCADLYDADAHLGGRVFDIVFVSWGAIEWLPDLERWAGIVARHLAPGGTFYMAEIHPFAGGLDEVPGEHDVRVGLPSAAGARTSRSWSRSRAATPTRAPITTGLVSYGWDTASPRSSAPSPAPACASSICTSSPPRRRRSGTGWCATRSAGGGCPDGKGGLRKDLPLSFSIRATKPAS